MQGPSLKPAYVDFNNILVRKTLRRKLTTIVYVTAHDKKLFTQYRAPNIYFRNCIALIEIQFTFIFSNEVIFGGGL
jgi:hypothetical protein